MAKDYYNILGVDRNATKAEIKRAYKRLAKKYHPDLNKEDGSAEKFKEISAAASVLADDNKRKQYDQFGTAGEGFSGFRGFDFSDFMSETSDFGFDFDRIFDTFFGGGRGFFGGGRRSPRRGADLRYDLEIELEDAAFGAKKTITVPRMEICGSCGGKGAKSDSDIETCNVCKGTGYKRDTRRTPFGYFSTTTVCGACGSRGEVIKHKCPACNGTGRVEKTRKIEVDIPNGVEDGTQLRISGEGEAGDASASTGDLYVMLHINEHDIFDRHGDDIHVTMPISFVQATLGGEMEVPTLKGKATLKIPAGTQSNTLFRMKGKGIPHLRGYGTGDQMVKVVVYVPEKLTGRQKEILQKFAEESGERIKPSKSFFSKIRDAF